MGDNDDAPVSTAVEEPATTTSVVIDPLVNTDSKKVAEEAGKTAAAAPAEQEETADEGKTASPEETAPTEKTQETETAAETTNRETEEKVKKAETAVTPSGKKRPPYVYDPDKITLRFLFANRDGLSVMVRCDPADTVGEVKGALLSVWPEELPSCSGGDSLRLICMGKGILMPDSRTLEDFQVPVFRTHPTPVNVAVRPAKVAVESKKPFGASSNANSSSGNRGSGNSNIASQGCACVIL